MAAGVRLAAAGSSCREHALPENHAEYAADRGEQQP
jgi:hypothetical protein